MGSLYNFVRPFLFLLPPEMAHHVGLTVLKSFHPIRHFLKKQFFVNNPSLPVTIRREKKTLTFPNPVGLAAGFDKNAEVLESLESLGFGFLEGGTITPRSQLGNQRPRIFRFPEQECLINRLGFNNQGVHNVSQRLKQHFDVNVPVGFNIGKCKGTPLEKAVQDYLVCMDVLSPWADFFVINVSSPNTPGLRDLQGPKYLEPLLTRIKEKSLKLKNQKNAAQPPFLFVKISPDEFLGDMIAEIALRTGVDGIVATNTTRHRNGLPDSAPSEGGMSGRLLKDRSTETIRQIYKTAGDKLTIIGVGGVFSAEDAYEKILAGASLVEVYTGFIYKGYNLIEEINQGLISLLKKDGFSSIQDAVGKKRSEK